MFSDPGFFAIESVSALRYAKTSYTPFPAKKIRRGISNPNGTTSNNRDLSFK
jgi:hypothetical protein